MLREQQQAWAASLRAGRGGSLPAGLADRPPGAGRRFAVHCSNVTGSLTEVLGAAFPVLRRLAGETLFRATAQEFIRAAPPALPQLLAYGAGFAEMLETFLPAAAQPAWPDLARLEWARVEAVFAADAPPLEVARLSAVPMADYPGLRFRLHPSARLISSPHAIQTLWDSRHPLDPARPGSPERVLVLRPDAEVAAFRLGVGEATLLGRLAAGDRLAEAAAAAGAVDPGIDLTACLAAQLVRGTFSDMLVPSG